MANQTDAPAMMEVHAALVLAQDHLKAEISRLALRRSALHQEGDEAFHRKAALLTEEARLQAELEVTSGRLVRGKRAADEALALLDAHRVVAGQELNTLGTQHQALAGDVAALNTQRAGLLADVAAYQDQLREVERAYANRAAFADTIAAQRLLAQEIEQAVADRRHDLSGVQELIEAARERQVTAAAEAVACTAQAVEHQQEAAADRTKAAKALADAGRTTRALQERASQLKERDEKLAAEETASRLAAAGLARKTVEMAEREAALGQLEQTATAKRLEADAAQVSAQAAGRQALDERAAALKQQQEIGAKAIALADREAAIVQRETEQNDRAERLQTANAHVEAAEIRLRRLLEENRVTPAAVGLPTPPVAVGLAAPPRRSKVG